MKKQLVFLMPRIDQNVFTPKTLLDRQNLYASYFAIEQGVKFSKAIALYSGTNGPIKEEEFAFVEPVWLGSPNSSLFDFFLKSLKYLKTIRGKRLVLVAGTPFQPLLIARLLSLLIRNSSIQVSVHGEIASIEKSKIKYTFLKSQLRRVSALRFVSQTQMSDFVKAINVSSIPTVITPVPIDVGTAPRKSEVQKHLAFVGRIHEERDPLAWAKIANSLPEIRKLVIGDGPLLQSMKTALRDGTFLGILDKEALERSWSKIGILLSTAPYESYGLTVREALLNEVPVVARVSVGVSELAARFPNLVRIFNDTSEAIALIHELEASPPRVDEYKEFKEWFVKEQSSSLTALAKLWASI